MAYIENLYKDRRVLMFKKVWATEKIHGSSSWVTYDGKRKAVTFHAGGANKDLFREHFDKDAIFEKAKELWGLKTVKFHGENYGGKTQGMSHTYGDNQRFVLFDVKIGDVFVSFENVIDIGKKFGMDVVDGVVIDCTLDELDRMRDTPSVQAVKNGVEGVHEREGIVIKPLEEFTSNDGKRVISKHKGEKFSETAHPREVSEEQQKVWKIANDIAEEWVTPMRLNHVLDKFPADVNMQQTGQIIKAMMEDVTREGEGEIEWTRNAQKAIGKRTGLLFREHLQEKLRETEK